MSGTTESKKTFPISISMPSPPPGLSAPPETPWQEKILYLTECSEKRNWEEALKVLTDLSTSRRFPHTHKAAAQRAWMALKSNVAAIAVVTALREVVMTIGPQHELAGPMGALAYFLARHRKGDDAGREFAVAQAQQMLHLICESQKVPEGEQAFQDWVVANRLNEPDFYLSKVIDGLEVMVMGDWWFDRNALQEELNATHQ
ncbi:MAG: hypothetical protein HQL63_06235 [Magnetococcales bacterium]|nr:hypothetical protein [Magnetococcales bacterium]MBF0321630.1 hypothetical protein [Magnetococcales bacterium]